MSLIPPDARWPDGLPLCCPWVSLAAGWGFFWIWYQLHHVRRVIFSTFRVSSIPLLALEEPRENESLGAVRVVNQRVKENDLPTKGQGQANQAYENGRERERGQRRNHARLVQPANAFGCFSRESRKRPRESRRRSRPSGPRQLLLLLYLPYFLFTSQE